MHFDLHSDSTVDVDPPWISLEEAKSANGMVYSATHECIAQGGSQDASRLLYLLLFMQDSKDIPTAEVENICQTTVRFDTHHKSLRV